jgi:hypothetical protein
MFGIIDILFLILIRRRTCTHCGRSFWAAPPHRGTHISIGRERHICVCSNRYETGRREWAHLNREQRRRYLWSGLLAIPAVLTVLAAIGGCLLRWQQPFWVMGLFLGLLGLLGGLICSAILLAIRSLPIAGSVLRTRFNPAGTAQHATELIDGRESSVR